MRLFRLVRSEDVSGVSGTGVVAEGILFSDGHVALRWCTEGPRSTVIWEAIGDVVAIHGHDGRTQIAWVG